MYVVFGATGHTGNFVANALLDRKKSVRAVVRGTENIEALRAKGAEVISVDVEDASAVAKALEGAEGAYVLLPPTPKSDDFIARGKRIAENFAKAFTQKKTPHVVFLTAVGANLPSGTGPIVTLHNAEEIFQRVTTTTFTFVRCAYFMENILDNAQAMKADGVLPAFGGGETYPFPMVSARDIGDVAAGALLEPAKTNSWIELSGPKDYSLADAASEATTILGRRVKATPIPLEAFVPTLLKFGFSENVANLYREMQEAFGSGRVMFEGKGRSVRGKVTLAEALRAGLK